MAEFDKYRDYLLTQKEEIFSALDEIATAPKSQLKFGPEGILIKLADALSMYISPNTSERRDQLLSLGFDPKVINYVDLNGACIGVALRTVEMLSSSSETKIHDFAQRLKGEFETMFG